MLMRLKLFLILFFFINFSFSFIPEEESDISPVHNVIKSNFLRKRMNNRKYIIFFLTLFD